MSFSDIKLYPVNGNSVIKANGSFVYNNVVRISCSVVLGKNGLFVSLPREKYTDKTTKEEKWADKVFFTDKDVRDELNAVVVAAYNKQSGRGEESQGSSPEPVSQTKRKTNNVPF